MSRTLFEEVRFDERVNSVDWATYPILEIGDAPERIDRDDESPRATGRRHRRGRARDDPGCDRERRIRRATGVRMRRLPLTAERVKAALK